MNAQLMLQRCRTDIVERAGLFWAGSDEGLVHISKDGGAGTREHWEQHPWDWIRWAGFSYPFNLTWVPAATCPCGFTPDGNPITPTPNLPSGVRGSVILGPTCPVGEPGATDPIACLTPYAAQLVIVDTDNNVVGRVTSGADGRFEIDLAPGDYVITPLGGDPYPQAQPVAITVPAGGYAEVQINFDTGIR